MILSILICTLPSRREMFQSLYGKIIGQISACGAEYEVEVLWDENTNITTGRKRNYLIDMAKGTFIVFIDDDDEVSEDYVESILNAIKENPQVDCIGMAGYITFDGAKRKDWSISITHGHWHETPEFYLRTPNHISPVKREIAKNCKFPEISYGEDMEYSKRILPFCKNETYIDKQLYHYKYITIK
jgi:glycosyltransferase involved in cell wall biosynthesis